MIRTHRTQSLTDFKANDAETLARLNTTNQAEVLTENGEARAVLLSPRAFGELIEEAQITRDAELIRRSIQQQAGGESRDGFEALKDIKQRLAGNAGG